MVLKLLKNIDICKAPVIDNFRARFLKDGAVILAKPVTKIIQSFDKIDNFS